MRARNMANYAVTFAFDRWWCYWILRVSYFQRVTNDEVMRRTASILPATQVIRDARQRYFGHVGIAQDNCSAVSAALKIRPNQEWKRPPGRPRATWLRTVEKDLALLNLDLHTASSVSRFG